MKFKGDYGWDQFMRNHSVFTLIELVTIIAIMTILAASLFMAINQSKARALKIYKNSPQ